MKLRIQNGAVEIEGNDILENVNFEVNDNDHIAIVGKNGAGKTTLLNAIINNSFREGIGDLPFEIQKIGNFKIGYLEQVKIDDNKTLYDELTEAYSELINLEKKIEKLSLNLTNESNIKQYSQLMERYENLGGYSYKKNIEVMINRFGFSIPDKSKLIRNFSGGEKMKISFMKLLLSNPDLLILDEPTNHLDINTIEWLEEYLNKYKGSFIVVSHDRMFLDNIVNVIYDIEYGETIRYVGNYTKYIKLKEERYNKLLKDYEFQQAEIKRLTALYERFRSKPKKAKMALSKLKMIERMQIIDKPRKSDSRTFKTDNKNISKSGKDVLSVKDLEFGYDKPLGNISFNLDRSKKLGIIGANGIGKSTLLKTLSKIIKPLKGTVSYGYNVNYAYFDQNLEFETDGTILEEFRYKYPDLTIEEAKSALGAFLFTGIDSEKELKVLSGGEKVRLLLCEIFFAKPNLIFLDEPTNHLDILNKEKLEKILKDYPETIVFVSHDRYFVSQLADELLVIDNNKVDYYRHGYSEYIEKKKNIKEIDTHKNNNHIKKEIIKIDNNSIKKIEKKMNNISNRIKNINDELYNQDNYNDYEKINNLNKELEELNKKLNELENEWYQLTDCNN